MTQHERPPVELKGWQHGAIFLFACLLMLVRRPDAVLHAQFWAEDGRVFFADAYNLGWWPALFRAYDGYFHLAPRLAASFALLAPLTLAPLITNLIAIAIQALPVNLLLGARSAGWGSLRYRFWLAGVYLALPNCSEISYGITNSQWVLALSAFLLLVASPAKSAEGRIASLCFLVFAGLTGPFCIFLFPIALCVAWRRRVAWRWVQASVLAVCGLVQAWCLLVIDPAGRIHSPLGASLPLFSRILGGHICVAALLGSNGQAAHARPAVVVLLAGIAVAGTLFGAICFARTGFEMRLFLVLSAIILAASLVSPTIYSPPGQTRWQQLLGIPGMRYWFFPTLACDWSILWAARSRIGWLRKLSIVLLCALCVGVVRDWRQSALEDFKFAEYAARFDAAPPGTLMTIPLNPGGWNMQLLKHASR
ncbi:MAG: hypothetical protein ACLQG3_12660 [Terracidiphilus sp.]